MQHGSWRVSHTSCSVQNCTVASVSRVSSHACAVSWNPVVCVHIRAHMCVCGSVLAPAMIDKMRRQSDQCVSLWRADEWHRWRMGCETTEGQIETEGCLETQEAKQSLSHPWGLNTALKGSSLWLILCVIQRCVCHSPASLMQMRPLIVFSFASVLRQSVCQFHHEGPYQLKPVWHLIWLLG